MLVWMAALPSAQAASQSVAADPLGQDRLLIMCLPNDREETRDEIEFIYLLDWDGFEDRDLRLIGINENTALEYKANNASDASSTAQIITKNPINAERIKKRVNCTQDFELILVGKDTGVKARWKSSFSQEDLFNRIDAMPMRRFEMKQKAKKN